MTQDDWQLIGFTVRMAATSLLLVVPLGLAVAWWLARYRFKGRGVVETLVALPLVVPPVVTGLVLLKLFGRSGPLGHWLHESFGLDIAFTWRAVVIAGAVMSFPLFVRSVQTAFEETDPIFEQIARTLGAREWRVFFTITLPLARRGVMAGLLLAFARALGEFGATIMVAGNISGQTSTMSMAIYQSVQIGEDSRAWLLSAVAVALAFVAVSWSGFLSRRGRR